MKTNIRNYLKKLSISSRLVETATDYFCSLVVPSDKHTQSFAALESGKDDSLFSNLLNRAPTESAIMLNRAAKRRLRKLLKIATAFEKGAPWKLALLIDATLHVRTSKYTNNVQKFNHGNGFVTGHQWTNIGFYVGGQFVPLPPIPFYTKEECVARGMPYQTEHEKVASFIKNLNLKDYGINLPPSEVVVLMDSGYDNKAIENEILAKKFDFIIALKAPRTASHDGLSWVTVSQYVKNLKTPWKLIKLKVSRGKKQIVNKFNVKQRVGRLKGVHKDIKIVCSKKQHEEKIKTFASSNLKVSETNVIAVYRLRWKIELFHRDIKSYLGLEDAGVKYFDSLNNHLHYVYLAYHYLKENYNGDGIKASQIKMENAKVATGQKIYLHQLTMINGTEKLKNVLKTELQEYERRKVA